MNSHGGELLIHLVCYVVPTHSGAGRKPMNEFYSNAAVSADYIGLMCRFADHHWHTVHTQKGVYIHVAAYRKCY